MTPLFTYNHGTLRIGPQPEGGGGAQKVFEHKGIELWLGSYKDDPHYAYITLPRTANAIGTERPEVEVIASKFYDELKELMLSLKGTTSLKDEAASERLRDFAFAAIGHHFGGGARLGGVILGSLYDFYQAIRQEGVQKGRQQVARSFQDLLDEA